MAQVKNPVPFLVMVALVGCGSASIPETRTATIPPTQTQANPLATHTIQPSATNSIVFPELGGSQAWIEKNFKLHGFQFEGPYGDGEREASYGRSVLQKSNGDLYDMDMQIVTTSIGYSLVRSNFLVVVTQPLSEEEMGFVSELFCLFWATSTNSDGMEAADWIDATLPTLTLNTESKRVFGIIQTRINIMPVETGDSPGALAYSLTLWVDPAATTVGEAVHISVEAITPLEEGDQLRMRCWDYEDPDTTTWFTSPTCVTDCATDNPSVFVSKNKITVHEGFPVTHDQWSIKVVLDPWRFPAPYPPYTYQFGIVFHGRTYVCTNSHEFSLEGGGEAGIFVEIRDGEQHLFTDDPVGMICTEE